MTKAISNIKNPIAGIPMICGSISVVQIRQDPTNKAAIKIQTISRLTIRSILAIGASLPIKFKFTLIWPCWINLSTSLVCTGRFRLRLSPSMLRLIVFWISFEGSICVNVALCWLTIFAILVFGSRSIKVPFIVIILRASMEIPLGSPIRNWWQMVKISCTIFARSISANDSLIYCAMNDSIALVNAM